MYMHREGRSCGWARGHPLLSLHLGHGYVWSIAIIRKGTVLGTFHVPHVRTDRVS